MGKTNPLNDEDLAEFVALQREQGRRRQELDRWTVADLDAATWDLSVKNPNAPEAEALRSPEADHRRHAGAGCRDGARFWKISGGCCEGSQPVCGL